MTLDWSGIQKLVRDGGKLAFAFALGGWIVSIRAQEASIPYKTVATHQMEQLKSVAGPNPLATIKCERNRANKAEAVADEFAAGEPILAAIPNCPPPPKPKASAK